MAGADCAPATLLITHLGRRQFRPRHSHASSMPVFAALQAFNHFHPATLYASAGSYGCVSVFLSLCLSQVCVLSKRLNEPGCFWVWNLPSIYRTLCYKEIQVPSKIKVLPPGTLVQTLNVETFATAYRSSKRVVYQLSSRKADAQSVINRRR